MEHALRRAADRTQYLHRSATVAIAYNYQGLLQAGYLLAPSDEGTTGNCINRSEHN